MSINNGNTVSIKIMVCDNIYKYFIGVWTEETEA